MSDEDLEKSCFGDDEMFDFDSRVKSFGNVGKWFESGPSSKKNMARLGLYVPDEDHRQRKAVKCVYCRHLFLDWTRNDIPETRHMDESPECMFIGFGKSELELKIKELIELHKYATLQKLAEDHEQEKALLLEQFEDMKRSLRT